MGEAQFHTMWSPLLRDERAANAPGGDFGMLRPWRAPVHEAARAVQRVDTRLQAGDLVSGASLPDTPPWLTEPPYVQVGAPLPPPDLPLDNAKFLQATLWRVPPAPAPQILREGAAPGVALTQLVSHFSARSKAAEMQSVTVTTATRAPKGVYPLSEDTYFYHGVPEMLLLNHLVVNTLVVGNASCDLYVGCQRLSLFNPESRRTRALLGVVNRLYLFGMNDTQDQAIVEHPQVMRFIVTPRLKTLIEWFWLLVVDHPRGPTALVAQQVGGSLWAESGEERRYSGFWTFDPAIVRMVVGILQDAGRTLYFNRRG